MSAWAKPGVKCVCVADETRRLNDKGLPPFRKGEVLTISDVAEWPGFGLMLYFVERGPEQCGHIAGFRPVISKSQEQDVGLFVHHLESAPVGEDA